MNNEISKEFHQSAMRNGTILGVVWSAMYLLLFMGTTNTAALMLVAALYFSSPFIAAKLAIKYRRTECNDIMPYTHAWLYVAYMYLCATLLSTLVIYIYFTFIDGGTFFMSLQSILDETAGMTGTDEQFLQQIEQTKNILEQITIGSFVWQNMSNNLFSTSVMSLVIALFVKRKG